MATKHRWGASFTNLISDAIFSGVNSATLIIALASTDLSGYQYRAVVSNGVCSATTTAATLLVNPVPRSELTILLYARPSAIYGKTPISAVVDVSELKGVPTSGLITAIIPRSSQVSLTFDETAVTINGRQVQDSSWHFDDTPNKDFYRDRLNLI